MQEKKFRVAIEDLTFETIIGILDFERTTPQKVVVNIKFSYRFKNEFINYAEVASFIKETMKKNKYFLIEDALEEITQLLKEKFPPIESIDLKIEKPAILPDCRVSVALVS
jgi:dihydroneopterin aldolase